MVTPDNPRNYLAEAIAPRWVNRAKRDAAGHFIREHGLSYESEYHIWRGMVDRCHTPTSCNFSRYGARGISVCDRWRNSCANFMADMGARPSRLHSIERIDNNGDYEPGNCKWATVSEQGNNTRVNYRLSHNGVTLTVTQWARRLGIDRTTLSSRIRKYGWSTEEALALPVDKHSGRMTKQERVERAKKAARARLAKAAIAHAKAALASDQQTEQL